MSLSDALGLPGSMQVIEIVGHGKPDVLVLGQRTLPRPGYGEVLIKVAAAGVNRPDIMQRMGLYPPPDGASDLPGLEVAGEIAEIGPGVTSLKTTDKVCALVAGGGYAAYCLAHAEHCLPIPNGLNMTEAAGLPECFFTVWTNVFDRGALRAGESILIHGGSSGIGTTAIQLAAHFGARVFATAGTQEKCEACEGLGAEKAINYRDDDFVAVVQELTGGQGVNLVLDMVGGGYVKRNIEVLSQNGRMVLIAFLDGAKMEIDMMPVLRKWLKITGSTLRPRSVAEKQEIAEKLYQKVWPLLASGKIRPQISATFPLAEAYKAHELMESGHHIGKIVLTV
ncbi:MAG: Quinone oxidoreductase 1 [Alphaproteobacteria bacterium MarineAlpha9_Bin7]|nr:MAG: Quinone oxidoreductase 1 [Alphaproteobacteria bacterium MarineAlpha9_Bin7]